MTPGRRRKRFGTVALAVVSVTLGVTACTGSSDEVPAPSAATTTQSAISEPPTPSSTVAPSSTVSMPASLTPAQIKAATSAIEAYRQYTLVLDQVRQNGGQGADLLKVVATQQALAGGLNAADTYSTRKWRLVGETKIVSLTVRSVSLNKDQATHTVPEVVVDTCEDMSGTDVVGTSGESVRPPDLAEKWKSVIWIRYYPESKGIDGWLVGRHENKGVISC